MTTPEGPASDTAQLIQALKDNARRLGLTWQITMATVVDGSDPGAVALQFDSDDTTTPGAISTVGYLNQGERCYVVQVPPAGNYITGRATGPYRARAILSGTQSSVLFAGIPISLRNLTVRYKARTTAVANIVGVTVQVGGDGTAVYSSQVVFGTNATPQAAPTVAGIAGQAGLAAGSSAPAKVFGSGQITFEGWDRVTQFLGYDYESTVIGTGAANFRHDSGGGVYMGSASRTSLTFLPGSGSFIADTDFQLYGEPS